MQTSGARPASTFTRALIVNMLGLLLALGLAMLVVMVWQGTASTQEAAQQEIRETLIRTTSRLQAIVHSAELAAQSVERVARASPLGGTTLYPVMAQLLGAFEQQPDLSYMGLTLPQAGEYGNLQRLEDGSVLLWVFPGDRRVDPTVRNYALKDNRFVLHQAYPTDGYDPRTRPFYKAAVEGPASGAWMFYQWIVHSDKSEALWGFSYVKALRDERGKLLGVLDTDFDMPALNHYLRVLSDEFRTQVQVVELGAAPRLIGAPSLSVAPRPVPSDLEPLLTLSTDEIFSGRMTMDGERQWVAARRVTFKGMSWLVVASRTVPFIEAPLSRQLLQVLCMGLAVAVGLAWLSVRIAHRFGKPLVALTGHVTRMGQQAGGTPNAVVNDTSDSRFPTAAGNFEETRHLGEALDRMFAERRQIEEDLRRLAMYDNLTGLANRNLIQSNLRQALSHARRHHNGMLALLYLDLDRFKVINDGYGHLFGDAVLKCIGAQLVALVRESDTVARLGGDEFLILLPELAQREDASSVARKIIATLDRPIVVQGREVHLSGSLGVALFPGDGDTVEALIDNADMAMYRAKDLGRNNWQSFTPSMSQESQRRVDMESKLRGAAAAGQLHLVYQPKVCFSDGRITGCEALLRWQHPELGNVPPSQLIPIAEESGLIVPIGDWVLRTVCEQARAWMDAGLPPVCIAVNLSARQFLQQDVVAWVTRTLEEAGVPPDRLELELTESLIVQDVEKVTETTKALNQLGVKVSIDDFGTGYSSLNYLKRFHVDTLKIDQSFVRNMLSQKEDETIVQAIIALAHKLHVSVIAEGVETEQHCHFLRQNGCDELQGYYFSPPVAAAVFAAMLREGKRMG